MAQKQISKEIQKCRDSPYYFATNYLTVKNHKNESVLFTTLLSEEEFNEKFKIMTKTKDNGK